MTATAIVIAILLQHQMHISVPLINCIKLPILAFE